MKIRPVVLLALAFTALAAVPSAALGTGAGVGTDLARARRATVRFQHVQDAVAAGYAPITGCVSDPQAGVMGVHFAHAGLMSDRTTHIEQPEILLYAADRGGRWRLEGVEYWVEDADQDLSTHTDRPTLFQRPFNGPMLGHVPGQPIHFDLHVWIWRHNPAGLFANYNPALRCEDQGR